MLPSSWSTAFARSSSAAVEKFARRDVERDWISVRPGRSKFGECPGVLDRAADEKAVALDTGIARQGQVVTAERSVGDAHRVAVCRSVKEKKCQRC